MSYLTKFLEKNRPLSFEDACEKYPYRYTANHVPAWALYAGEDGLFEAPHFKDDLTWYLNTNFPGEKGLSPDSKLCESMSQYPIGEKLPERFDKSKLQPVISAIVIGKSDEYILRTDGIGTFTMMASITHLLRSKCDIVDMSQLASLNGFVMDVLNICDVDKSKVQIRLEKDYIYPEVQEPDITFKELVDTISYKGPKKEKKNAMKII